MILMWYIDVFTRLSLYTQAIISRSQFHFKTLKIHPASSLSPFRVIHCFQTAAWFVSIFWFQMFSMGRSFRDFFQNCISISCWIKRVFFGLEFKRICFSLSRVLKVINAAIILLLSLDVLTVSSLNQVQKHWGQN